MAPPVNYDYDAIGRLAKLTDHAGAPTSFLYDKRSLLLSRTDPLLKTASLTYYDDGKVRTSKDRNNKTTTYTPSGKPATVSYQDGATVSFSYDQHDNLIGMQDALGAATYAYDPVMRLTSATDANGFTVSYEYDEAGNVTRLIYPGGRGVSYTYDELNRLKSVTIDWLKQTAVYSYDVAGRLTGLSQFNGAAVQFGYDDANRLTALDNRSSQASNVIAAYHFTLDANGNRIHVEHQAPLGLAVNAMSTDFSYNSKRNRLLAAGTTDFAYDDEGQLATKAQATYAFDSAHRLMSITGTGDDQFSYDGAGRRLSARRSGTVTRYIHDAAGNLLAEADGSGAITRYYIHGAGLLAMVTPAGALYCYHFDATGYTVALTDSTRTVVNKYAYSPFGAFTNQVEAIAQPFKFVGQFGVITEPNGLIYMRARYYDPQVGRFISEDPIGFDGGDVNLYAYVENNPVNWVDPVGLNPWIQAENFLLIYGPEIIAAVDSLLPHMPANHYVGQLYSSGPELTNALIQANQNLGNCILGSLDYLAMDAGHDIINRAIPFAIDSIISAGNAIKDEWVRQNMNPVSNTYIQQGGKIDMIWRGQRTHLFV